MSTEQIASLPGLEAAKYWLRACLQRGAHARWMGFLRDEPGMGELVALRPQLLWKLQRGYLQAHLPLSLKLDWLMQHHRWALRTLPAEGLRAAHTDAGWRLAELPSPTGTLQWVLRTCERYAKEGEWVLGLRFEGRQVAALAFTVHLDAQHRRCAHVGCLQGAERAGERDLVREATKAMHGLRPKQAVTIGLYAVAAALQVPRLQAVGNASHVYQGHWRRRERIAADYDGFWLELGGLPQPDGWQLPTLLARKACEEVASKHRAAVRRRQAFEDLLIAQVGERVDGTPLSPGQVFGRLTG
jgi:uncharacterized protein VirK/YbjX